MGQTLLAKQLRTTIGTFGTRTPMPRTTLEFGWVRRTRGSPTLKTGLGSSASAPLALHAQYLRLRPKLVPSIKAGYMAAIRYSCLLDCEVPGKIAVRFLRTGRFLAVSVRVSQFRLRFHLEKPCGFSQPNAYFSTCHVV